MTHRTPRALAAVAALALLGAACSDDDTAEVDDTPVTEEMTSEDTSDDTMTDDETSEDTMSDEEAAQDEADIVDTAVAAGDFDTLVTAVQAAGLEETLRSEGPFTVFAPTDAAFEALPAGTLDELLADPEGDLADILTYHVVEGEVYAEDVVGLDGEEVATVNGAALTVAVGDDGTVTLIDAGGNEVGVVQTDIETSNGVIHVLDAVLLP